MGLPEICVALAIAAVLASPLAAQGKPKHYATTTDKAITITREVLVKQGYEVVKIERTANARSSGTGAAIRDVARARASWRR
jgi:hypothetical protein